MRPDILNPVARMIGRGAMAYYLGLPYQAHANAYFEWDHRPEQLRMFGLSTNIPLGPDNLPTSATRTRGKQTPDIFAMPGLNAVNGRFRELVETFEPDTHLFHPLELKERDGSKVDGEWYIFSAQVAMDCVLTERSGLAWDDYGDEFVPTEKFWLDEVWETHPPDHRKSRAAGEARRGVLASAAARGHDVSGLQPRHLYVSRPAIAGHHLWTGNRIFNNNLWVSDEFFRNVEKMKLKHLASHAYGFEVDEPWVAEREIAPILSWEREHQR